MNVNSTLGGILRFKPSPMEDTYDTRFDTVSNDKAAQTRTTAGL